jgi:hypothetical protein
MLAMSDAAILLLSVSAIGLGGAWIGSKWIERDAKKTQPKYVGGLDVIERIERIQKQAREDYARVVGPS